MHNNKKNASLGTIFSALCPKFPTFHNQFLSYISCCVSFKWSLPNVWISFRLLSCVWTPAGSETDLPADVALCACVHVCVCVCAKCIEECEAAQSPRWFVPGETKLLLHWSCVRWKLRLQFSTETVPNCKPPAAYTHNMITVTEGCQARVQLDGEIVVGCCVFSSCCLQQCL